MSQTDALGGTTSWLYDANGNVIAQTDANGNTTHYVFDSRNRETEEINALGGVTQLYPFGEGHPPWPGGRDGGRAQ